MNTPFTTIAERALESKGLDFRADVSLKSIRLINKLARDSDEPHLYPYVNSADKAIRWYSRVYFPANGPCSNLEYIYGLESQMSHYVNNCG